MSRKIVLLMIVFCCLFITATPVWADETQSNAQTVQATTPSQVQAISPEEGADRISNALMKLYLAGLSIIPNYAMVAILIGVILSIVFAAFGASRMLTGTLVGLGVIVFMVVVAYAAPFIASVAQGVGQGL